MHLDFAALIPYTGQVVHGLILTILLSIAATVSGLGLAVAIAYRRSLGAGVGAWVLGGYIELTRNTPFIVQLFFMFFGLASLGLPISALFAAYVAMTLNLAAYTAEILRAGIEACPRGQHEASRALGFTRFQSFRHVILLPSFARVYPAVISQCIIVMLGSAVVSQISVFDLTFAANFIQSRTFRGFEIYLVVTAIYLLLAIAMRLAFNRIGARLFVFRRGDMR